MFLLETLKINSSCTFRLLAGFPLYSSQNPGLPYPLKRPIPSSSSSQSSLLSRPYPDGRYTRYSETPVELGHRLQSDPRAVIYLRFRGLWLTLRAGLMIKYDTMSKGWGGGVKLVHIIFMCVNILKQSV